VSEFTRSAILTTIDLTVENDPRTDTPLDQHENEIANLSNLGTAKPQLRVSCGVRVVVDRYRQPGCLAYVVGKRQVAPFESRNEQFPSFSAHQTGQTDADAFDRSVVSGNQFSRELDYVLSGLSSVRVSGKIFLLHYASGEIAGRDYRSGRTNVDADRNRVRSAQREQDRRTSACRFAA